MIELGQWYKVVPEGIRVCIICRSENEDTYLGWIGGRGGAINFQRSILLGQIVYNSEFNKMNVPFKEHSMIKDIFEKEWVE